MKNKQRGFLKILAIIIPLFFSCSTSFSQTSTFRLNTADSLFQAKQYTQSFEHYEEILKQKQYTPAMLLKMAYIQEGLEHIGKALYYLNLYYAATHDLTTQEKIQELAAKYNLEGYDNSETDQLLSFYHKNRAYVSMTIAAFMVLVTSLAFYTRQKLKRKPFFSLTVLAFLSVVLFAHLYYGEQISMAIVANPSTYVMSGPSAGASVVEIIGDGHRVEVIGQKDVWLRVRWDGNIRYIKESAVLPIRL